MHNNQAENPSPMHELSHSVTISGKKKLWNDMVKWLNFENFKLQSYQSNNLFLNQN